MKTIFILFPFIAATIMASRSSGPKTIRKELKGTWTYSYSLANKERKQIPTDKMCPAYRMVFSACTDSTDMKRIGSPVVHKMRKQNVLRDLKCITYDSSAKKTDTYFPVLKYGTDSLISMLNYGYIHKNEYYIDILSPDSMVIHNDRVYTIDNKPCYEVKHVYYRKK